MHTLLIFLYRRVVFICVRNYSPRRMQLLVVVIQHPLFPVLLNRLLNVRSRLWSPSASELVIVREWPLRGVYGRVIIDTHCHASTYWSSELSRLSVTHLPSWNSHWLILVPSAKYFRETADTGYAGTYQISCYTILAIPVKYE